MSVESMLSMHLVETRCNENVTHMHVLHHYRSLRPVKLYLTPRRCTVFLASGDSVQCTVRAARRARCNTVLDSQQRSPGTTIPP